MPIQVIHVAGYSDVSYGLFTFSCNIKLRGYKEYTTDFIRKLDKPNFGDLGYTPFDATLTATFLAR